MDCFGIGTTRLLAASVEVLSSDDEVRWPRLLAPYQICIIPQKVVAFLMQYIAIYAVYMVSKRSIVKPLMFACPLFREFREPNKTAKLKGANISCGPVFRIVWF